VTDQTTALIVGIMIGFFIGSMIGCGASQATTTYRPKEAWELYQESIELAETRYAEAMGVKP
jgi:hypothetical protein